MDVKKGQDKCNLLLKISGLYVSTDPLKAFKYATEAEKLADEISNSNALAEAYNIIGMYKSRAGDYPAALKSLTRSREIYKKLNNETMAAFVSNDIAGVYSLLKRYDDAVNLYTQLLARCFKENNMDKYCSIMNNMGVLLNEKGDYDKALENFSKVMAIIGKKKPDDKGLIAVLYCNIGESYFGKTDYGTALKYRKMSLSLFKEVKNVDGMANLQMDIGSTLTKLRDYGRAKLYLDSALVNYSSIKYPKGIRDTKRIILQLYTVSNQVDNALSVCTELEKLCISSGDSSALTECYEKYAQIYYAKNNFKPAAEYYRKYINLKENLDFRQNKQRMFEQQAAFDMEEKEFENKSLRQENELQKEKITARGNIVLAVSVGIILASLLLITLYRKEKR